MKCSSWIARVGRVGGEQQCGCIYRVGRNYIDGSSGRVRCISRRGLVPVKFVGDPGDVAGKRVPLYLSCYGLSDDINIFLFNAIQRLERVIFGLYWTYWDTTGVTLTALSSIWISNHPHWLVRKAGPGIHIVRIRYQLRPTGRLTTRTSKVWSPKGIRSPSNRWASF